ncbi:hypothetical protein ANCCAN_28661 [Ancylostoma caninum]|uniref:Uncharacterized protein n=1 Tax=Ancylostoma caninum TaxID=29170 RepID=A0A368F3X5_ANCCA|nr:hypothetical protein ANCCAN_28661 [Ancylostoma caninum]
MTMLNQTSVWKNPYASKHNKSWAVSCSSNCFNNKFCCQCYRSRRQSLRGGTHVIGQEQGKLASAQKKGGYGGQYPEVRSECTRAQSCPAPCRYVRQTKVGVTHRIRCEDFEAGNVEDRLRLHSLPRLCTGR